jgi:hypothetical protein
VLPWIALLGPLIRMVIGGKGVALIEVLFVLVMEIVADRGEN